jgi:hypothetical protein
MSEASPLFLERFGGVGSPSITCNCGRRHHAPTSPYIEEAEKAEMLADAKENPGKVLLSDDDGVSAKHVGGLTIVPDCPCGVMGKLEAIIWSERAAIITYFKNRGRHDAEQLAGLDDVAKVAR